MIKICLLFVLVAVASAQRNSDPRQAAILSEQRYQQGDGSFGTQYKQEDGVDFKEETDAYGNRKGSYTYVDPSGQRRTVSYTAGKDGFMATGDHLPQPHVPHPQYTPDPQYNPPQYQEPEPQYNPQPQYQPQQQYQPQPQAQYRPQPQPQYQPQAQYQPQQQYQPQPQQYQPQPQQYQPQPQYHSTTPAPHRFYPPGKLSLQRSPDGYSYSFNKA